MEDFAGMGRMIGGKKIFVKKADYFLLTEFEPYGKKLAMSNFDETA
jgi:hypothetical protein